MSDILNILCFAGNDWWVHNPSPEKHWMTDFARSGHTILYINSIGVGMPFRKSSGVGKRYYRKFKSLFRYVRKPLPNLWVLTPIVIPLWSIKAIAAVNKALLFIQIKFFLYILKMKEYIFWAGLPTPAILLSILHPKKVIYYYQDLYTAYYEELAFSSLLQNDDVLYKQADKIICASKGLYNLKKNERDEIYYTPHGVNRNFLEFDITKKYDIPDDISQISKPIFGYWGSLEILQDQNIIDYCARKHPEWSFIFIGNPVSDISIMKRHSNVYFLGFKSSVQIPFYAIHFDVCIMNFVQNDWIRYSCPVKLREYLAMGKSIVSVPIIEAEEEFSTIVRIAKTPEEFCIQCEEALKDDSIDKRIMRKNLVKNYSWEHTARKVLEILQAN